MEKFKYIKVTEDGNFMIVEPIKFKSFSYWIYVFFWYFLIPLFIFVALAVLVSLQFGKPYGAMFFFVSPLFALCCAYYGHKSKSRMTQEEYDNSFYVPIQKPRSSSYDEHRLSSGNPSGPNYTQTRID